jgi:hypothetical protein
MPSNGRPLPIVRMLKRAARWVDDEREQNRQARSRAQNSDGLEHGAQIGNEDAGGLEGSDAAGAK